MLAGGRVLARGPNSENYPNVMRRNADSESSAGSGSVDSFRNSENYPNVTRQSDI